MKKDFLEIIDTDKSLNELCKNSENPIFLAHNFLAK